jgi:hypothetical protein
MGSGIVERDESGRWQRGSSGNPAGRRVEGSQLKLVRQVAREHTVLALNTLAEIAADQKAQPMARVRACEVLLARGWGQPSPEADVDVAESPNVPRRFIFQLGEKRLGPALEAGDVG